jgi:hypothetical protein
VRLACETCVSLVRAGHVLHRMEMMRWGEDGMGHRGFASAAILDGSEAREVGRIRVWGVWWQCDRHIGGTRDYGRGKTASDTIPPHRSISELPDPLTTP